MTSDPFSVPHQPDFAQPFAQDSFGIAVSLNIFRFSLLGFWIVIYFYSFLISPFLRKKIYLSMFCNFHKFFLQRGHRIHAVCHTNHFLLSHLMTLLVLLFLSIVIFFYLFLLPNLLLVHALDIISLGCGICISFFWPRCFYYRLYIVFCTCIYFWAALGLSLISGFSNCSTWTTNQETKTWGDSRRGSTLLKILLFFFLVLLLYFPWDIN